jgi:hypothetical protein
MTAPAWVCPPIFGLALEFIALPFFFFFNGVFAFSSSSNLGQF